jgi:hypothetical protein
MRQLMVDLLEKEGVLDKEEASNNVGGEYESQKNTINATLDFVQFCRTVNRFENENATSGLLDFSAVDGAKSTLMNFGGGLKSLGMKIPRRNKQQKLTTAKRVSGVVEGDYAFLLDQLAGVGVYQVALAIPPPPRYTALCLNTKPHATFSFRPLRERELRN